MTYSKQTWNDDDPATPLSAARLAHMEDGIEEVDTHVEDAIDAHDAAAISVQPNGVNVAGNVQASLVAIDAAKVQTGTTVDLTSAQTIAGVKAFSSSPTVPTPTTASQVAPKSYVDSLLGPSGTVTLGADQIFTGKNQFRGVTITNEAVDVRDSRFAGGALFDNSTNDTAAIQAAIDHAGTTVTARAGNLTFPEGTAVINATLLYERKALNVRGQGWGPTGSSDGTCFRWTGNNTTPMMRIRQGMGMNMENFRLLGNKTPANTPTAGIDLNVDADTQQQPNTLMTFDRIWFGPFTGYDEASLLTSANYLLTGWSTSGDEPAEDNLQNDISSLRGCVFFKCGTGYKTWHTPPGNTQAVINKIQSCDFHYCGTGVDSIAQTLLDNNYFAFSSVTDLHIREDRFTCFNLTSEYAARGAIIENNGELIVHTGYFQVGEKTHADGKVFYAVNDTRTLIDFSFFDFRYQDVAYASTHDEVANPPKAFSIKALNNGTLAHKILGLHHVNWGVGGLRQNLSVNELDIDPGKSGNGLDDLLIYGHIQGAPDASGSGITKEIYNYLHYLNPTADFSRDDRRRVKAGAPLDADYLTPPPNGTQVLDSSSNRLYVRVGGVWRYTTLT